MSDMKYFNLITVIILSMYMVSNSIVYAEFKLNIKDIREKFMQEKPKLIACQEVFKHSDDNSYWPYSCGTEMQYGQFNLQQIKKFLDSSTLTISEEFKKCTEAIWEKLLNESGNFKENLIKDIDSLLKPDLKTLQKNQLVFVDDSQIKIEEESYNATPKNTVEDICDVFNAIEQHLTKVTEISSTIYMRTGTNVKQNVKMINDISPSFSHFPCKVNICNSYGKNAVRYNFEASKENKDKIGLVRWRCALRGDITALFELPDSADTFTFTTTQYDAKEDMIAAFGSKLKVNSCQMNIFSQYDIEVKLMVGDQTLVV